MTDDKIIVSAHGKNIVIFIPSHPLIELSIGEANRLWADLQDAVTEAMKEFETPGGVGITHDEATYLDTKTEKREC